MTDSSPAYRKRAAFVRGAARDHLRQLREDRIAAREAARAQEIAVERVVEEVASPMVPEVEGSVSAAVETPATPPPKDLVAHAPEVSVAPAAEAKVAPQPLPVNPKVPLSPSMRRMLQARASSTEHPEAALVVEPEVPTDTAEVPATECEVEPKVASAEPEAASAVKEGAAAPSVALEPSQEPEVEAAEEAVSTDAPLEELSKPEPVLEAEEPLAPVPDIAAAEETAMTPLIGRPDLARLPGAGPGLIWMLNECEIHTLSDLAAADCTALTARMGLAGRILDLGGWIAFARSAEGR